MSQQPVEQPLEALAERLIQAGHYLAYPSTPDIAGTVQQRLAGQPAHRPRRSQQLAWTVAIMVIVIGAVLLAVPSVRAAALEVLRLGAVRIFLIEPTPTARPSQPANTPGMPAPTPISSVLDLAGETTLAEAQRQVDFPIRLPTEPEGLGPPDKVFLQNLGGPFIVLIWLEPNQPDQVQLSLHQLGPNTFAEKGAPELIQETIVKGQRALWVTGPHFFELRNGTHDIRRLVEGHVLIWTEDEITYRLETGLPLKQAVRLAESLER